MKKIILTTLFILSSFGLTIQKETYGQICLNCYPRHPRPIVIYPAPTPIRGEAIQLVPKRVKGRYIPYRFGLFRQRIGWIFVPDQNPAEPQNPQVKEPQGGQINPRQ